jgi:hypothetical protein
MLKVRHCKIQSVCVCVCVCVCTHILSVVLNCSKSILMTNKLGKLRWTGHLAQVMKYKIVRKAIEKRHTCIED